MDQSSITGYDKVKRNRKPLSKALQIAIFRRDCWLCYWCKKSVVFSPAMRLLDLEVKNALPAARLAYYHPNGSRAGSPLLDELTASIDHIEAFSTGGACNQESPNVVLENVTFAKVRLQSTDESSAQNKSRLRGNTGNPRTGTGLLLCS